MFKPYGGAHPRGLGSPLWGGQWAHPHRSLLELTEQMWGGGEPGQGPGGVPRAVPSGPCCLPAPTRVPRPRAPFAPISALPYDSTVTTDESAICRLPEPRS